MTTIRDLLNDFAKELLDIERDTVGSIDEQKDTLIDEYTETIKERIVG